MNVSRSFNYSLFSQSITNLSGVDHEEFREGDHPRRPPVGGPGASSLRKYLKLSISRGNYLVYWHSHNGPGSETYIYTIVQHYKFIWSYLNIPMKANCKQNAVKLTASKIGTHVMVQVVTK